MWRRVALLVAVGLALTSLWAFKARSRKDSSLETVQRRSTLRVGLDASFPPFEVVTADGLVQGLDADLARLLARELGVAAEIRNIALDGLYDALMAGEIDIVISALPYDPLRTQDVSYSRPYFVDGIVLIGPAGQDVPSLKAAQGSLAAEMGSEATLIAERSDGGLTATPFLSEEEVMEAVATSQVDWGLASRTSACLYRREGGAIQIGPLLTEAPYCAAVAKTNAALAEAAFAALDSVIVSAEWNTALATWLGEGC